MGVVDVSLISLTNQNTGNDPGGALEIFGNISVDAVVGNSVIDTATLWSVRHNNAIDIYERETIFVNKGKSFIMPDLSELRFTIALEEKDTSVPLLGGGLWFNDHMYGHESMVINFRNPNTFNVKKVVGYEAQQILVHFRVNVRRQGFIIDFPPAF